jgi:hypothetical protein
MHLFFYYIFMNGFFKLFYLRKKGVKISTGQPIYYQQNCLVSLFVVLHRKKA